MSVTGIINTDMLKAAQQNEQKSQLWACNVNHVQNFSV